MEVKALNKSFNKIINESRDETLNKLTEYINENKSLKIDEDDLDEMIKDFKKNNIYNHKIFNDGKKKGGSIKKREPTKYNLFVKYRIKEIRANDDKINNNDAMKKVGSEWGKLSDNDKKEDIENIISKLDKLKIEKKSPPKKR